MMTEEKAKNFILIVFSAMAALAVLGMSAAYILDPLQIFHSSWFVKDRYVPKYERFQNAGLIRRMLERDDCCDTVIIGTSHSQNFLPSYVDKIFKAHGTLQLSLPGPLMTEQEIMHRKASQAGEIKRVIWDIHDPLAEDRVRQPNDSEILRASPGKFFPLYLYDDNKFNDYLILASADTPARFIDQLLRGKPYETYQSWYGKAKNFFGRGEELGNANKGFTSKKIPGNNDYTFPNIDQVLVSAISNHPEQEFFIFFPPYSRHFYAVMTQEEFSQLMAMRIKLAKEIEKYPNAKLFAFDDWTETKDLDNYKDQDGHYSEEISKKIIDSLAAGKGRLRASGTDENIRRLTKAVNAYIDGFESAPGKE
jgi:hypothetical protein